MTASAIARAPGSRTLTSRVAARAESIAPDPRAKTSARTAGGRALIRECTLEPVGVAAANLVDSVVDPPRRQRDEAFEDELRRSVTADGAIDADLQVVRRRLEAVGDRPRPEDGVGRPHFRLSEDVGVRRRGGGDVASANLV